MSTVYNFAMISADKITFTSSEYSTTSPQTDANGDLLLYWKIRCVDRRNRQQFDRDLYLHVGSLPIEEQQIVHVIAARSPIDVRIVAFRGYFKDRATDDVVELEKRVFAFKTVYIHEYFEDEAGNSLDLVGFIEALNGRKDLVILGNLHSVIRRGPCAMVRKELWDQRTSNTVCHFFSLIERICRSTWWASKLSITYGGTTGDDATGAYKKPLAWDHPDVRSTREILMAVRQLYSNDDAFNFACKAYLRHVSDPLRQKWVEERKASFNRTLNDEATFLKIGTKNAREVLDLLIYGSGEVHRESDKNTEEEFASAIRQLGDHRVYVTFGIAVREIVSFAAQVYHVMKQDFDQWQKSEGIPASDRVRLEDCM